ncbi:MAG TPA: hypothetical protein VGO92_04985, partial [Acidimicrobiales bacterium]|nr:hypothetical protein [Acidimicrobiales bacterium]
AVHIVLHATDDDDAGDIEGPDEIEALDALNSVDVRHVGIYPYDGGKRNASKDYQTVTLRRYAEKTSTLAPAGGLDCDGDGETDVAEFEPVVCAVPQTMGDSVPMASVVERVLLALASTQPVEVVPGPSPLGVEAAGLGDFHAVDLREAHSGMEFRVQATCPPDRMGTEVDVPLQLQVGGVVVALSSVHVACMATPRPPAPEPPVPPRPPRVLAALPPPAPAPPALAESTATAEASSAASSSAHAAQTGLAVLPEDAPELTAAYEDEARFTANRRIPAPGTGPAAAGLVLATALSLLYAVQPRLARRER